jgi:bifunctional non-homologous end joining protein LigD
VVQKHAATRLHYDFRLEMEGVLKSWAVPKGPSLDPADKRLAMQVEDHPVSYFDFEGNIPEQLWRGHRDGLGCGHLAAAFAGRGQWKVCARDGSRSRRDAGQRRFEIRLNGKRLKGDFALVKMRGRRPGSKGNEWLMIKKHDEFVEEGYDIESIDESVLSGRTLERLLGDAGSAEWKSRPAGRGS